MQQAKSFSAVNLHLHINFSWCELVKSEIYRKQSEKFYDLTSPIGTESLTAVIPNNGVRCIKYVNTKNVAKGIRSKRKEAGCSSLVSLQRNRNEILFYGPRVLSKAEDCRFFKVE